MKTLHVVLAAVALQATAACYPIWSGNTLEDRVAALDNATRENRAQQDEMRREITARLDKLDDTLDRLTKSATRTTAEVAAATDDLLRQVQMVRGELEEMRFRFDDVSKRFDTLEQRVAALGGEEALRKLEAKKSAAEIKRPTGKQQYFDLAKSHYDKGDYEVSRLLFGEFVDKWRFDDLSPRAQLYIGDSYFAEKQYRAAVLAYQKVRETWPTSKVLPDALYKLGLSFIELGLRDDAVAFLEEAAKFPSQEAGKKARAKLTELKKSPPRRR